MSVWRLMRGRIVDGVERYLGSDPGGERFRSGLSAIVAWTAAVAAAALFELLTHAFEVSSSGAGAAAANRIGELVVLMIGSTVALTAGFVVADATVRARARTSLLAGLGLWAGIAVALAVHPDRPAALVLLVIVPSAGAWFRRYGPRGFASSFSVHVGYLIGFLAAPQIGIARLGWVGGVIAVSAVATYAAGLLFLPGHARAPQRMRRSYRARARRTLALTAELMDASVSNATRRRLAHRLRRQVLRMNETALVLDVQLAASSVEADERRRRALFEHERAVGTLARLARLGARDRGDPEVRAYARAVVGAALDGDRSTLLRLAARSVRRAVAEGNVDEQDEMVERYREAAGALASALDDAAAEPDGKSEATGEDAALLRGRIPLVAGWLPGAAIVNSLASSRGGAGWRDRFALPVSTRVAVQLGAALTLAVVFAGLISPDHLLWAVVAVYVTFLGSTSDYEQRYKAALRVAGTLLGVIVGGELAQLTAPYPAAVLIVLALAAYFMSYFGRVNYALVVFAATLGVTQFYAQVGELSNTLLITRVEVTAVGAACAILVGLLVLPLRTVNAATLAVAAYIRALADVLDGLTGTGPPDAANGASTNTRLLDTGFHAASAALRPLTRRFNGAPRERCARVLRLVDVSHDLGRVAVHDSALAPRTNGERAEIAAVSKRTATVARMVADDLERPTGSRAVASIPTASTGLTSSTANLRTDVEGIAAAIAELAQMRGLAHS